MLTMVGVSGAGPGARCTIISCQAGSTIIVIKHCDATHVCNLWKCVCLSGCGGNSAVVHLRVVCVCLINAIVRCSLVLRWISQRIVVSKQAGLLRPCQACRPSLVCQDFSCS
jgi:hypothetical protein